MFKRIDHVEFVPADFQKTLDFYTKILGFTVQRRFKPERPPLEEIVFIELGGTSIELFSVKNPPPASQEPWRAGWRKIALQVEDLAKALEYLKSQGVEVIGNPATTQSLRRAEIKDPDGLLIELTQPG